MQRGINYDAMKTNNTNHFMCKNLYTFKIILTDNIWYNVFDSEIFIVFFYSPRNCIIVNEGLAYDTTT